MMTLRDVTGMMIRLQGIIPKWRQVPAIFSQTHHNNDRITIGDFTEFNGV